MKATLATFLTLLAIGVVSAQDDSSSTTNPPTSQAQYKSLAQHWAPRIYHDTDSTFYLGDYITKFNFDGDYNGRNNWENLSDFSTVPAYVYYAVVETTTHYFLSYAFFHPRDWDDQWWVWWEEHENDLEGISLCIKKTGGNGSFTAMATRAHTHIYTYGTATGIERGSDGIDGIVSFWNNSHPKIFIEAKGHGVYNCDSRCSTTNGDGIVYFEGDRADSPNGGDGSWSRHYSYTLIAMDQSSGPDLGLWHLRNQKCDDCAFASWGRIRGDDHGDDLATAPWAWDDGNDGQVFSGDLFCDPALFFDARLDVAAFGDEFSHTYVSHPYRTHVIQIYAVRSDKDRDSSGNKSDLYVKVIAERSPEGGDVVIDSRAWKKNNAIVGKYYNWSYGAFEAEGERSWGATFNRHSFCRPQGTAVTFRVYDSDSNSDDFMGGFEVSDSFDGLSGLDVGDARIKVKMDVFN